jgi:hypothetical protein
MAALAVAPLGLLFAAGFDAAAAARALAAGLLAAVSAVGWVLVPQLVLAVGIGSLAVEQLASRAAGLAVPQAPTWLDPAVESALLLGLLGTIHGMVSGFVGLSPEEIEAGPLVHSLGTALRSSFVGFGIALVGVWTKTRPSEAATP